MSTFEFAYHYYIDYFVGDIYKPYQMSTSVWRPVKKVPSDKKKDLIESFLQDLQPCKMINSK